MQKSDNVIRACCAQVGESQLYNWSVYWEYRPESKFLEHHYFLVRESPRDHLVLCDWNTEPSDPSPYGNPRIIDVYQRFDFANNRLAKEAGKYACSLIKTTGHRLKIGTGRLLDLAEANEFFRVAAKEFLRKP